MIKKRKNLLESRALWHSILFQTVVAILLAAAVLLADWLAMRAPGSLPAFLLTPAAQAQNLLITLSGSFLTVTIFLYSTTMVVLTTYSAQFSPRVIENFLNNKSTARIFGIFIGAAIYCIVTLVFVRKSAGDTFLITGVAMAYALACVAFFIIFILSVSASIQVQNLLATLYREAVAVADRFVSSREDTTRTDSYATGEYQQVYHIPALGNGFFEENDIEGIRALLRGQEYLIVLYPRMGDFVSAGQRIASLYYNGFKLTDEIEQGLGQALLLEEKRYIRNDYRFAIQKIVEVALKALSPSINDPNTAIYCIRYLGILAGRLGKVDGKYAVITLERESGAGAYIVDQDFLFADDLRDIFIQIVHYGREDVLVVAAVLEALKTAILAATPNNRAHILSIADYVYASTEGYFQNPLEKKILQEKRERLEHTAVEKAADAQ